MTPRHCRTVLILLLPSRSQEHADIDSDIKCQCCKKARQCWHVSSHVLEITFQQQKHKAECVIEQGRLISTRQAITRRNHTAHVHMMQVKKSRRHESESAGCVLSWRKEWRNRLINDQCWPVQDLSSALLRSIPADRTHCLYTGSLCQRFGIEMGQVDDASGAEIVGDATLKLPDGKEIALPYLKVCDAIFSSCAFFL